MLLLQLQHPELLLPLGCTRSGHEAGSDSGTTFPPLHVRQLNIHILYSQTHSIVKAITASYTAMEDNDERNGSSSEEDGEEEEDQEDEVECTIPTLETADWEAEMFGEPVWKDSEVQEELD